MSDTYDIIYDVKGNALVSLDAMIAKVKALDAAVTASKANMKGLGTPGGGGAGGGAGGGNPAARADASLADALPSLAAAMTAIRTLTGALDAMGEAAVKARQHLDQGAQSGLDKRGKAREYANLLQHEGPDDEVMGRLFGLAKSGGYKFDDAVKFGEQFLGSSPAGVQAEHVTPEQLNALEVEGARFANRIGLDPFTGGDLAGTIPQYVDLTKDANGNPLSTEQGLRKAMGQLGALQYGLNEGRGKISTLARSELGAAAPALAAKRISDHAEMGAFVGIASTFTKTASSSGTAFKQFDNLINNSSKSYLQEIGVNDARGDFEKLRLLKKDIDARKAADPNFDVLGHLHDQGFSNRAERDATAAYVANFDVLEKRRNEARRRAGNGQDVIDANRRYSTTLEGQNQLGDAMEEYGTYAQTERRQRLAVARKFALGQLRAEDKIDTSASNFNEWAEDFVSGPTRRWSGEMESRATGIDARVRENLVKSARSVGIDLEKRYPGFSKGYGEGVTWDLDKVYQEVGPELEKGRAGLDGGLGPAKGTGANGIDLGSFDASRRIGGFTESERQSLGIQEGGPSGGDSAVVSATRDVGQATRAVGAKIDRQTEMLLRAMSGRPGPAPVTLPPIGDGGAGVNPGRR